MSTMPKERKEYLKQYQRDHIKRVPLNLQIEDYERMKNHIESRGETVNGFIKRAIAETIAHDIMSVAKINAKYKEDSKRLHVLKDFLLELLSSD